MHGVSEQQKKRHAHNKFEHTHTREAYCACWSLLRGVHIGGERACASTYGVHHQLTVHLLACALLGRRVIVRGLFEIITHCPGDEFSCTPNIFLPAMVRCLLA